MKNFIRRLMMALMMIPSLSACSTKYSAEPIMATVVDAETNRPIEGVIVIAHWELEGGLEGGNNLGQMMVMEAVTDKEGVFRFPAWGPKAIPDNLESNARLKEKDPGLLFYKFGYKSNYLQNSKSMDEIRGMGPEVRTSDWNGKIIKLEKFKGGLREYSKYINSFNYNLWDIAASRGAECEWKNLPKTIFAMEQLTQHYEAVNISAGTFYDTLLSNDKNMTRKGCGSVKEFIGSYKK